MSGRTRIYIWRRWFLWCLSRRRFPRSWLEEWATAINSPKGSLGSRPNRPPRKSGSRLDGAILWQFLFLKMPYLGQSPQICTVIIFGKTFWIFLFCFHSPWIYIAFRLHLMKKIVVKLENFFYPFCANFRRSHVRTWDLRFSQIYMI